MVKMGAVWDRTAEVIGGRTAMLASIAGLTLWLPSVIREAIGLSLAGNGASVTAPAGGASGLAFVVSLVVAVLTIFGQLALIAVASDPATTRREAYRVAAARLPVAIGLALLIGLAVFVLMVPPVIPIAAAMPNPAGMTPQSMASAMAGIAAGTRTFVVLYVVVLAAVLVWLAARLALLNPVIVNERAGVRSIARSFALTRGSTWRIVGLAILLGIVSLVVILAVQSVVGIAFRLILGADNAGVAALLTDAAVGVATSAITIVWTSFVAQLYVAARQAPAAG